MSVLKKISKLPQPTLCLSHGSVHTPAHTHPPTRPCLSLNTSPGGSLITYKAVLLVYLVRPDQPLRVASTDSAFPVLPEQVHTLCSHWPLGQQERSY